MICLAARPDSRPGQSRRAGVAGIPPLAVYNGYCRPPGQRSPCRRIPTPQEYEELIRVIHDRHDRMSKTYRRIAVCLTRNPNNVAIHSVNGIANRCDIHA